MWYYNLQIPDIETIHIKDFFMTDKRKFRLPCHIFFIVIKISTFWFVRISMLIQKNIKFLIAQYEYCQKSHSIWPSLANYVHFPVELPVSNYLQYSLILQSKYFLDQCNLIILSKYIFVSWRYHLLLTVLTIYNLYFWLICFHMPPVPRVPKHNRHELTLTVRLVSF